MPTKPIRDPSLDTLLEGLEERLDQGREAAKLRVHTPPSAHTDPFPEEPVVAPHLTAPLSSRKAALRVDRNASARPTRKLDPTFVLERPEGITARTALVTGSAVVAVLGALGVAVWVPRGSDAVPVLPRAEPVPSIVALAAPPAPLEPIVVRSPPSAATKASGAHPKLPPKAVPSSGLGVDGRLDGTRSKRAIFAGRRDDSLTPLRPESLLGYLPWHASTGIDCAASDRSRAPTHASIPMAVSSGSAPSKPPSRSVHGGCASA